MSKDLLTIAREEFEAWYEEHIGDENKPVREAAQAAWLAARVRGVPALTQAELVSNVEDLFGEYWNIAYREGSESANYGDEANDCLNRLRMLFGATPPAPAAQAGDAEPTNPAVAAIEYALKNHCDGGMEFLRCWMYGEFDAIRREWPDAPGEVFIGADPLFAAHPAPEHAQDRLHTFLNAAAGEGLVLDGVDAADLYIATFPERYKAAASQIDPGVAKHAQGGAGNAEFEDVESVDLALRCARYYRDAKP